MIARSPTALETIGLTLRHGRRTLLDACSLRVPRGAVCGLVGPNGAGKSLLLSAAAGLVAPQEGEVTVLGLPAGDAQVLPEVGFVDQQRSLYRRMTVAELLETGRRTNVRWQPARAQELLDLGRVPLGCGIGALSGGQRTLVAVALARAKAPKLLLLDEPLADLDPLVRRAVMGLLLTDVADEGVTVLLSTHILTDLDEVVDHLVLLDGGRVRLAGELPELLAAHRYLDRGADDARPWPGLLVEQTGAGAGSSALVRLEQSAAEAVGADARPTLEELVLSYLRSPGADRWLSPGMRPDPARGVLIP